MSIKTVCRLCLMINAPTRVIADSPLQSVYEKLTGISLNTDHRPVVACYLCYTQLRNCHKLMVRSMVADRVLARLQQRGKLGNEESFSILNRVQNKISNDLCITPVEIVDIEGENIEYKLQIEIKEEPVPSQCIEEMDLDPSICSEQLKCGTPEDRDTIVAIKNELLNELLYHEDEQNEELEGAECPESMESEGASSSKKSGEQIHEEQAENESTVTTDGNNIQGKSRTSRQNIISADKHIETTSEVDIFKCDICQWRFTQKESLQTHLRVHTDEKPLKRGIGMVGNHKCRLKIRLQIHDGKPFKCEECKVRFQRKEHLNIHLEKHTSKKLFQCDMCNLRFTHNGNFKRHLQTHTGERPFKCEICKVTFTLKGNLKTHLLRHAGEKPFECKICKATFAQKGNLKAHLLRHAGEKPFECKICKATFAQKGNLKAHLLSHAGEKPFECEFCKLRFTLKGNLKTHLLRHTGEKPFECDICKVRFNQKSHLKNHLRTHYGNTPYICKICKVSFRNKSSLRKHLIIHG